MTTPENFELKNQLLINLPFIYFLLSAENQVFALKIFCRLFNSAPRGRGGGAFFDPVI
jgi:hypothetical protein